VFIGFYWHEAISPVRFRTGLIVFV
jgi:hypothetical protein